jgi:hypothetical protein
MLGFSISYWDLIGFLTLHIPLKEGDSGWMQAQRQGNFPDIFIHPISSKGSHIPITHLAALLTVGQTFWPHAQNLLLTCMNGAMVYLALLPFKLIFVLFITGHHKLINNYFIWKRDIFAQSQSMIYAIASIHSYIWSHKQHTWIIKYISIWMCLDVPRVSCPN